ncbi:MAG: carbohydrate binding family 9 domain-containing protein [Planctomycetota bacterium]
MSDLCRSILFLLPALLALSPVTWAGDEENDMNRPEITVPTTDEAVTVDGILLEKAWARAAVIDRLVEVEPNEGTPASPPTEIRLMRDYDFLYVAFICYEPEMENLVLQDMHREGWQWEDDAVKITLDTFCDGKSGYYYLIDAAGSRLDALVADNGQRVNYSWDGFWEARVQLNENQWTAEFAIPFKALNFGDRDLWRVNFERYRGASRTKYRWTGWEREFRVTTMSEAGILRGMSGIDKSMGLEFIPYGKIKRTRKHDPRSAHTLGDAGGEINFSLTPQMTGSFTVNTDFAETEADTRRINLTRFSLFYPEKRDFFLQDSTLFEFGWESGFSGGPSITPFFSRRIGLSSTGEEIPIEYGTRLAGRVRDLDLGFLAVHTGADSSSDAPAGNLMVARPSWRVNEELTLGGMVTSGNPSQREENQVFGGDLRYVSTDTLPGLFSINAYLLGSDDRYTREKGSAYGIRSDWKTSDWSFSADTLYSRDDFHPALGYVRRPGERSYNGSIEWEPRTENHDSIRSYTFSVDAGFWTKPDGTLISHELDTGLFELNGHDGDSFYVHHTVSSDRLDSDFEPLPGYVIPRDDYAWQSMTAGYSFSKNRPLSGNISYTGGGWYNGRSSRVSTSGQWNPSAQLEIALSFSETRTTLPAGSFTTQIQGLNINYDFTPDIRLATLVQRDNISDNLGMQSRFRWIISDGRELFLVINSSWLRESGALVPVEQNFAVKAQYAIRF